MLQYRILSLLLKFVLVDSFLELKFIFLYLRLDLLNSKTYLVIES